MAKSEITIAELIKIDNEARRIERERVLKIVAKTREKINNARAQPRYFPNSVDKILEEMVDEMEGD